MFTEAVDLERGFVVWLLSGASNSDEDYQAYVDSIIANDRVGRDKRAPLAILVVDPGNPTPSSLWRKRIADASMTLASKPLFVLVSPSPLMRGVMAAINWLRPPSFPFSAQPDFDAAVAWIVAKRGPTEGLHGLLAAARAKVPLP